MNHWYNVDESQKHAKRKPDAKGNMFYDSIHKKHPEQGNKAKKQTSGCQGLRGRGELGWLLNGYVVSFWVDENALQLHRTVNVLNMTELHALKGLTLLYEFYLSEKMELLLPHPGHTTPWVF